MDFAKIRYTPEWNSSFLYELQKLCLLNDYSNQVRTRNMLSVLFVPLAKAIVVKRYNLEIDDKKVNN